MLADQVGRHLEGTAAVVDLRIGTRDLHQVLLLIAQPPGLGWQCLLGALLDGQDLAPVSSAWLGCFPGKLPSLVSCRFGLQHGDIDRSAVGTAVLPGLPRLGGSEVGASDFQGLVALPVVVVLPEADQELGEFPKVFRGSGRRGTGSGFGGSVHFSLGLRVTGAAGNASAPVLGQESLGGPDGAAAGLIE